MIFRSSSLAPRVSGALLLGCSLGLSAPNAYSAPTKTKAAKKASATTKGSMLQGAGVCTLQTTFSNASAGLPTAPFASTGRADDRRKRIISSSTAQQQNGYSVVINFVKGRREGDLGPPRSEREVDRGIPETDRARERRLKAPTTQIMLTFSSPTGFYAGQTIPIVIPAVRAKPPAQSFMDFTDVVRIEGREVIDGNGVRRRSGQNRTRTWVAVSGTFRVQSVTPDRITFSLQNVRFVVPEFGKAQNAATGSFTMQGIGQCTFNEVD